MILRNSLNFINQFALNTLKHVRNIYLNSNYYDKKISKINNDNLVYKPSPHLLSSLIKYQKEKIKELKNIQKNENIDFDIEIDGGINFENSKIAIKAGANILVSGTTVFKSNNGDIKRNIDLLKSI